MAIKRLSTQIKSMPAYARLFGLVTGLLFLVMALAPVLDLAYRDFGTGDWVAYWAVPRGVLWGRGFYDLEWLGRVQQALGYNSSFLIWHDYPVILLWNPPPLLVPLVPLASLSFGGSVLAWIAICSLLPAHAAIHFNRTLARPLPGWLALLLPLTMLPYVDAWEWGQFGPLIGAFLIYIWLAIRQGRYIAAVLLLVPLLIKIHLVLLPTLFLAFCLLRARHWSAIVAGAAFIFSLMLAATLFDANWLEGWLAQGTPLRWVSSSPLDVFSMLLDLPDWFALVGSVVGNGLLFLTLVPRPLTLQTWVRSIVGAVIVTPYLWHHDPTVLLAPFLWMSSVLWNQRGGRLYLVPLLVFNLFQMAQLMPLWGLSYLVFFLTIYWRAHMEYGVQQSSA